MIGLLRCAVIGSGGGGGDNDQMAELGRGVGGHDRLCCMVTFGLTHGTRAEKWSSAFP